MKSFSTKVRQSFTQPRGPVAQDNGVSLVEVSERLVAKVCRDRDPEDPIDWNEVARVVDLIRYVGYACCCHTTMLQPSLSQGRVRG